MANTATQMNDLDALFNEVDGLDALDDLEFETEEAVVEEEALLEAAQEDLAVEEEPELEEELEVIAEIIEEEVEATEVSMDDVEAELKTAEREARLEEAAMSDEEAEAAKMSIGEEATKKIAKASKTPKSEPKDAINVAEVMDSKVAPTEEHWDFLPSTPADAAKTTILGACDVMPKKTREKAVNLMDWYVRSHSLSVYTKIALELLLEEGTISSTALRNRYLSNPGKSYTLGTANAQTGQVMKLLSAFCIINQHGDVDLDHGMVKRFKDIFGSAA